MVGLPFANAGSTELKERMKYVEGIEGAGKGAGRELYEVSLRGENSIEFDRMELGLHCARKMG